MNYKDYEKELLNRLPSSYKKIYELEEKKRRISEKIADISLTENMYCTQKDPKFKTPKDAKKFLERCGKLASVQRRKQHFLNFNELSMGDFRSIHPSQTHLGTTETKPKKTTPPFISFGGPSTQQQLSPTQLSPSPSLSTPSIQSPPKKKPPQKTPPIVLGPQIQPIDSRIEKFDPPKLTTKEKIEPIKNIYYIKKKIDIKIDEYKNDPRKQTFKELEKTIDDSDKELKKLSQKYNKDPKNLKIINDFITTEYDYLKRGIEEESKKY